MPAAGPRVAIVIVNYESYPELHTCLASLAEEAARGRRVIVVDHVSRDAAADVVDRDFPYVRLLRVPANEGFAAGVNRGARESDEPYLLLVNPDSVVDPGLVDGLVQWLSAHPGVGVVGPRLLNADGTIQASARRFPGFTTAVAGRSSWLTKVLPHNPLSRLNLPALEAPADAPIDVDWVSGACMLVRREAFEAVGGMDEGFFLYWEDADFCRRVKMAGWRTVYLPQITSMHIGGRSSIHAADASLAAFHRSAYRLFAKHASAPARLLSPLVYLGLRARLLFVRRLVRASERRERATRPERAGEAASEGACRGDRGAKPLGE